MGGPEIGKSAAVDRVRVPISCRLTSLRLDEFDELFDEYVELICEQLARGRSVTMAARGQSMWPFIRDGDTVKIVPVSGPISLVMLFVSDETRQSYYIGSLRLLLVNGY